MILKLLGCLMIILSTTAIGFIYSKMYSDRPMQLRMLQIQFQFLETEINYMSNTLTEAFRKAASATKEVTSGIFERAAMLLENRECKTAGEAWKMSLKYNVPVIALNNEDIELLVSFGKSLGNSDRESQIGNIRNMVSHLKMLESKAEMERARNEKLYRSLGILSGFAIVIMLV